MLLESMISILEHSAPIQLNVLIVESHPEPMDVDVTKRPIDLRLSLDRLYNMIVCKDCCVGLPSEWVPAHLRENHDIIVTDKQVYHWTLLRRPLRAAVPSIILCVKNWNRRAPQRRGSPHSGEGQNGRFRLITIERRGYKKIPLVGF